MVGFFPIIFESNSSPKSSLSHSIILQRNIPIYLFYFEFLLRFLSPSGFGGRIAFVYLNNSILKVSMHLDFLSSDNGFFKYKSCQVLIFPCKGINSVLLSKVSLTLRFHYGANDNFSVCGSVTGMEENKTLLYPSRFFQLL